MNREDVESMANKAPKVESEEPVISLRYRPFPVAALPEVVRSYVVDAAAAIPCDVAFFLLPLLAALGAAIGTTRRIRLKRSWVEFPIIWSATVALSGRLKSAPFEDALRPVYARQAHLLKEYKEAKKKYDEDVVVFDVEMREWMSKGRKEKKPAPTKPSPPVLKHVFVDDVTIEGLALRLEENPRGILDAAEELSGWFGSQNQYKRGKGSDESHWLRMHGGRPTKIDRKTGDRPTIYVPRAAVSITGTIQPAVLRDVLGRQNLVNGIAARILFAMPVTPTKCWTDREPDPEQAARVDKVFQTLYELKWKSNSSDEHEPIDLPLTSDALEEAKRFVNKHGLEQVDMDDDLSAAWAKLEGYAFRFALIHFVVRCASDGPSVTDPNRIDLISLRAGIELAEWFGHEARRIYAMFAESEEEECDRQCLERIERKGGSVTVREWQRMMSHPTSEDAEADLAALVEKGYGSLTTPPQSGSGRPGSKCFTLKRSTAETSDTDKTPVSGVPEGVVSDSKASSPPGRPTSGLGQTPRGQVAHRMRELRLQGERGAALALRDAFKERLSIGVIDGGLEETEAEALAVAEVLGTAVNLPRVCVNGVQEAPVTGGAP